MTRCPYCFFDLAGAPQATRCVNPHCNGEPENGPSQFSPSNMRRGPFIPGRPDGVPGVCQACGQQSGQLACGRCHADLPKGWRQVDTLCVVMAGARTSGKSVYLAVLRQQLAQLAAALGGAFDFAAPKSKAEFESSFGHYIFEERTMIPPTMRVGATAVLREPLVFHLGMIAGVHRAVVVRDIAGEDLEDLGEGVNPYLHTTFANADAIVFLFDPLSIPAVATQLTGLVAPPGGRRSEPLEVLSNVARIVRGDLAVGTSSVTTPLDLVIGKFDVLHMLRDSPDSSLAGAMRNVGAAINRDPSLDTEYDPDDAVLLEAEVRGLLEVMGGQTLVNFADTNFAAVRFFAASSLGAPPTLANDVAERGIAPFRVLDPLRMAMFTRGWMPRVQVLL